MAKKNFTKRALLSSVLAMFLCFAMLVGTTFAWFTDSVTSEGNIIQTGTLKVGMSWANGTEDPASANWTDASTGPIFNYDLWEPGYADVKHVQIENKGTLGLRYIIKIVANGEVTDLADVIDVYYMDPAVQVTDRAALTADKKLGTLTEVLAGVETSAAGELAVGEKHTITLALKMQEEAGNEYQDKSIGTTFSVVLLATQLSAEEDAFGPDYDKDALFPEVAIGNVTKEENVSSAVKTADEDVKVDLPADAPAGNYGLIVSDKVTKIDDQGNASVSMDIELRMDGAKVTDTGIEYNVSVNIGSGLNLVKLVHAGNEITDYTYDVATGVVTFKTTHFSPFEFYYNAEATKVTTADELLKGGNLVLANDITISKPLVITKPTVLDANGHTITYTGSDRAIDVPKTSDGVSVILKNLNVEFTASYCQRGINYNTYGKLTLENVKVSGANVTYAVNLPGSSNNCEVELTDCSLTGCTALNIWGASTKVTATNSEFYSVDKSTVEDYAAISINMEENGANAMNTVLNVYGGKIVSNDQNGEPSTAVQSLTIATVNVSAETEVVGSYAEPVALIVYEGYAEFYSCMTLESAIEKAVETNGKVVLIRDITLEETLVISDKVTINLNGYTLAGTSTSSTTSSLITVKKGAELTLTGEGTVTFEAANPDVDWNPEGFPTYANNTIRCEGKLVVDGVTIKNTTNPGGASYAIDCYPGADLVVNSGLIDGCGKLAIRMFCNSNTVATNVTINGGTITGKRAVWVQLPSSNISNERLANLTINGGEFICTNTEKDVCIYSYSYGDSFAKTNITITGGTFTGDVCFGGGNAKSTQENVTVIGGTFNGYLGRYLENDGWEDIVKP